MLPKIRCSQLMGTNRMLELDGNLYSSGLFKNLQATELFSDSLNHARSESPNSIELVVRANRCKRGLFGRKRIALEQKGKRSQNCRKLVLAIFI